MKIYVPAHTHCSECGRYAGAVPIGPAFFTHVEAAHFLMQHPNTDPTWAAGETIMELDLFGPVRHHTDLADDAAIV